jgi:hypothetical protein
MICIRISIEDPFQGKPLFLYVLQQAVGGRRSRRTGSWIKVTDRIDDGSEWVRDNILDAASCCLIESSHIGFHTSVRPYC